MATSSTDLLEAARSGDEAAFAKLIDPFRGELHAHCYRMLGSVHDAEDALQETFLRAWRGLARFEGRSSLRSWLYTIATNTCLNAIEKRPKRVLPIDYGPSVDPHSTPGEPLVESVWVEPYPDEELGIEEAFEAPDARYELLESVELAFVAALQHLPPNQRAALILREVLGFSAKEVAEALDTTVASVNSALQRARETVEAKLPDQSQQETLRSLGDAELTDLVESFMDAMVRHDVAAVVDLLAEDAAWSMPPMSTWFRGREALTAFLAEWPLSGEWRWHHVRTHANGQPAFGAYTWDEKSQAYRAFALNVLTYRGDKVVDVTSFINRREPAPERLHEARWPDEPIDPLRDIFGRFGLPDEIRP